MSETYQIKTFTNDSELIFSEKFSIKKGGERLKKEKKEKKKNN